MFLKIAKQVKFLVLFCMFLYPDLFVLLGNTRLQILDPLFITDPGNCIEIQKAVQSWEFVPQDSES